MPDNAQNEFADNTPRLHKIVRVIFFISTFSWSWNRFEDYASETPMAKLIMRVIPLFITVAYVLFSARNRQYLKKLLQPALTTTWIYIFFGVACGFTGMQPTLSIWKGFELIAALAWIITSCYDEKSLKVELFAYATYIEILMYTTLFLAVINPGRGFLPSPTGIPWISGYLPMLNPNTIGFLSITALARLLFWPARFKPPRIFIIALILFMAQSRTQYVVCFAVLIIFVINSLRNRKHANVLIASFAGICAALLGFGMSDTLVRIFLRGHSAESMSNLSGRTDYWISAFNNSGLFGGGLATGSRSLLYVDSETFYKSAVNLHSTYLEVIMGAGFLGGLPFLLQLVANAGRSILRIFIANRPQDALFAAIGIIFAARSFMSIAPSLFTIDFCLLIMLWVHLSYSAKDKIIITKPVPKVRTSVD